MGLTYEKSNPGKENNQKSDSTGEHVQKSTPVGRPVYSQVTWQLKKSCFIVKSLNKF